MNFCIQVLHHRSIVFFVSSVSLLNCFILSFQLLLSGASVFNLGAGLGLLNVSKVLDVVGLRGGMISAVPWKKVFKEVCIIRASYLALHLRETTNGKRQAAACRTNIKNPLPFYLAALCGEFPRYLLRLVFTSDMRKHKREHNSSNFTVKRLRRKPA